jgi:hypothetical protein
LVKILFKKEAKFYKISEDMWNMLHSIYGGGPCLLVNGASTNCTPSSSTNKVQVIKDNSSCRENEQDEEGEDQEEEEEEEQEDVEEEEEESEKAQQDARDTRELPSGAKFYNPNDDSPN